MRNGYNKTIIQELKSLKFPTKLSIVRVLILVFSFIVFYGLGWLCGWLFVAMGDTHPGQTAAMCFNRQEEEKEYKKERQEWNDREDKASNDWSLAWGLTSTGIFLFIFNQRDKIKK